MPITLGRWRGPPAHLTGGLVLIQETRVVGKWHADAGLAASIELHGLVVLPRKLTALACNFLGHDELTIMMSSEYRIEIGHCVIETR